jgi:hypothetical protein
MKQSLTDLLEGIIGKLTDKIEQEVIKISDKNFSKNMTALKKVVDTVDKLISLNEKLAFLKKSENNDEEDLSEKDKIMLENYFKARLQLPT